MPIFFGTANFLLNQFYSLLNLSKVKKIVT